MELGDVAPLPEAPRVVLDSNALDVLSNDPYLYTAVREAIKAGRLALLWTHVTIHELADIADCEKRGRLLLVGASLAWVVPTGSFIIGYSRLDAARLADDEDSIGFEEFRRGNLKETADALIGATAVFEHAMLATQALTMPGALSATRVRAGAGGHDVITVLSRRGAVVGVQTCVSHGGCAGLQWMTPRVARSSSGPRMLESGVPVRTAT